ncbi:MAG: hypothetical protein R2780_14105 [Crocinitomicaceae bacterium]
MEKLKWILSLLMVIMLIVTTNLVDKASFEKINDASEKIYSDRLVAQDLVLKYGEVLHKKELALELLDSNYYSSYKTQDDIKIEQLTDLYSETELTETEATSFNAMRETFEDLISLEKNYAENFDDLELKKEARIKVDIIHDQLIVLSEIQLIEGRKETYRSNREMNMVDLFTKMEIILIVVLSIVIIMLVFSKSNALKIKAPEK